MSTLLERGRIMGTREVAELFGVTPKTIRRWVSSGTLAAWETTGSRRYIFHWSDVTALLRRKEAKR